MNNDFPISGNVPKAVDAIINAPRKGKRKLVALAGPPASGKSTLAAQIADNLCQQNILTQVVPMDGFHLDNSILSKRGHLSRKGAPKTFDHAGLLDLVRCLKDQSDICFPLFDRKLDTSVIDAGHISPACNTVIIEGNYLLLDHPNWNALREHWDISIMLDVVMPALSARLVSRWVDHGMAEHLALRRAEENDLPNARLVVEESVAADVALDGGGVV